MSTTAKKKVKRAARGNPVVLTIPNYLAERTDYEPLQEMHRRYGDTIDLREGDTDDEMLEAIEKVATAVGDKTLVRVVDSIRLSRSGDFSKAIPQFKAAVEAIKAYLRHHLRDGWLYQRSNDGLIRAWLVTDVKVHPPRQRDDKEYITIDLMAGGPVLTHHSRGERVSGSKTSSITLWPADVTRKKVDQILLERGYLVETEGLREEYDAALAHHVEVMADGFAEQFYYTGQPQTGRYGDRGEYRTRAKVVHDLGSSEISPAPSYAESVLFTEIVEIDDDEDGFDSDDTHGGSGAVPMHFDCRVFDLATHEFLFVDTRNMQRYLYDATLRDKIVLPTDQRNLLDILTTNLDEFTGDVIEGKTTGNVVLCKGEPGVGKTLTAEIYSELIERPLYSIHSGSLGVSADDVRKNLETTFKRAKRWKAVLLLDEADVFVLERGDNIVQNAIVAEFLRTLEYFDGLMFMTTNRAKNIDDAILSRAAAIIDYQIPEIEGIAEVWRVQALNQRFEMDEDLLDDLVHGFARITPRDVKMLLRLALRVAKAEDVPLSTDIVAKCAMFRGLHFEKGSRP